MTLIHHGNPPATQWKKVFTVFRQLKKLSKQVNTLNVSNYLIPGEMHILCIHKLCF